MRLYPAIDIFDGQAVRLMHGKRENLTAYGNPLVIAKDFEKNGAEYLHVVDLNGAFSGDVNLNVVKEIVSSVKIPVQLGGGIRTMEDIDKRLNEVGVSRVILGTIVYTDPDLLKKAIIKYGADKIVCGIDVKAGGLAIRGWVETVQKNPFDLCRELYDKGVSTVIYTDITRDGTLEGSNIDIFKQLKEISKLNIIASGGVGSLEDIRHLKELGLSGVIIGKALYEGKFTLCEAIGI